MLECLMSDGSVQNAKNAWALVWCADTGNFTVQNPQGLTGLPNIRNLASITFASRGAFLATARDLARRADCKPMLGQDDERFVRVFLSFPRPADGDIGNWGQAKGRPAPI